MSNLQQLKDKQLQEFKEQFDYLLNYQADKAGEDSMFNDIKSFLTSSIELAYEEGSKKYKPAKIYKLSQSGNILQALIEIPNEDCEVFIKTKTNNNE